jgi:hypothetical protein
MTAAREQIFAELDARLSAIEGVAEYERLPSGDPNRFPAVHLFEGGQSPAESEVGSSQKMLRVTVEGYVKGGSGTAAHAAMNALHAKVVSALMTDPPLGGLAETVVDSDLRVDVAELASVRRLGFAQDFDIQFATPWGDPSQLA